MTANGHTEADDTREISALRSTSLNSGDIAKRILLAPWGCVESSNGSFVVDEESVTMVLRTFEEHATDLPIDYEHQTLGGVYSSPNGQAPAAGWVKRILGEVSVGLFAEIEWTEQAREMLASKEYRYLSPVAIIRKSDRKLVAIHSAALTNKPAIVGMEPIVNRVDAVDGEENLSALEVLREELNLHEGASPQELLATAGARLCQLRREVRLQHAQQRVRDAIRAGKLVEAQRTWAENLVALEEELFEEWFRTAPVVAAPGKLTPAPQQDQYERHRAVAAHARTEFRANGILAGLTSEDAYVEDACRCVS